MKVWCTGPDEGKDVRLNHFHLGHQRLSIIGLDDGIQPITNKEETKWVVVNGEIYNYPQLKQEYEDKLLTQLDSEIVLRLYEDEGVDSIKKLDGMFAFFLADDENNTFVAGRDTLGIKPLYYAKDENGEYVFASELKTLYFMTDEVYEFPRLKLVLFVIAKFSKASFGVKKKNSQKEAAH
ncbi:hypothetical protein [Alkalibacillus haloalkaliphilus]|uniref:hypothetical protein n=1 Tax=Alkalibacillus haloalkaliphilus TaxID=94136 RepID=UPI0002FAF542|nr:hypothetical protein [Alkalibacillus haloalkaliphilus]